MRGDKGGDGTDTAESAVDSSDSVSSEGDVLAANMDGATVASALPLTNEQLAAAVAANINAKWPNACAQVSASGANLVVTYNDCSGPRGLVHVTGTLNMALDISTAGAIDVHATGSGFEVNSAVLDIDADAVYSISGTQRSLVVSSKGTGIGPRGNDIDHSGDYTLTWDPATSCGSISGHWMTDFSNAAASAERSNDLTLSKCVNACPTGSLTHHYLGGASLTVAFDGSATAQWSASTGASGTIALACR
ncbi:MAG TPA: hypothetical protein VGC41_25165 [Kofleriaceae bacterium]